MILELPMDDGDLLHMKIVIAMMDDAPSLLPIGRRGVIGIESAEATVLPGGERIVDIAMIERAKPMRMTVDNAASVLLEMTTRRRARPFTNKVAMREEQ